MSLHGDTTTTTAERSTVTKRPSLSERFGTDLPRIGVGAGSLAAGAVAWDLYARSADPLFAPRASSIWSAFVGLLGDSEFWQSYATTLRPFLWGWAAAMVVGLTFGLVIGMSSTIRALAGPHLSFFNALPVSTLVPAIVIAFGIDTVARSTVVFLFAVIEVTLTAASGVQYVDRDLLDMGRSFGLGRVRRFTRIILPGSAPAIAAAVRIGTARAVVGMVVMELLLVSVGVGKLISRYRDGFDAPRLYAVVLSLAVFALFVNGLMRLVEGRAQPWKDDEA
ncbi:MAG: ABC transporter permease [Acidimicrobiia bacterium]|nr:ABC transporter permease [Acidimicrobiia bacterium]